MSGHLHEPQILKDIYLVRHTQSLGWEKKIYEGPEDYLSVKGKEDAVLVGKRLIELGVEYIFCSPYVRAKETLDGVIAQKPIPFEIASDAVEFSTPADFFGKSVGEELQKVKKERKLASNYLNPSWKEQGEENLFDFAKRGMRLLTQLTEHNSRQIAVITHAPVIKMLLALLITEGEALEVVVRFKRIRNFFRIHHGSITHLRLLKIDGELCWYLMSANDLSHLS